MRISGKLMFWIVGLSLGTTLALEHYRNRTAGPGGRRLSAVRQPA